MKTNSNIRSMLRIARIELNTMFYSPVAWLVLVIFAFQVGMIYADLINSYIHAKVLGNGLYSVTSALFTGMRGIFPAVTNYLYLYIPLVSMGLMSREFASGSIKLLYSSPVRNSSIIFGKYLAMFVYGLSLMAVLAAYVIFSGIVVENFDWSFALSGLLGIFLLLCTYSAIGLFMSTMTSYQVVAGVGTLAVLAGLNYIGDVGQSMAFVRDITYWLSIKGRVYDFINGMIPSDGVIYFLSLIAFFICVSIIKLYTDRAERNLRRTVAMYGGACFALLVVAFVSASPYCRFYNDTTFTLGNTLARESLDNVGRLDGKITITTYVNVLDKNMHYAAPKNLKYDAERFAKYTRFLPHTKMKYVYYWAPCENEYLRGRYPDLTDEELADIVCRANGLKFKKLLNKEQIDKVIDLSGEGYRFVRVLESGNGQTTFLRMFEDTDRVPSEVEITAALRKFVDPSPHVALITGHGDRTMDNPGSRGYKLFGCDLTYRASLVNQGFTPSEWNLADGDVPAEVSIVVLADLKTPLSPEESARLDAYIARGGNLLLLGDAGRSQTMNPIARKFGIEFGDRTLVAPVKDQDPTLLPANITRAAASIYPRYDKLRRHGYYVAIVGGVAIDRTQDTVGFEMMPLLQSSDTGVWAELETVDFIEDSVVLNPAVGEKEGVCDLMVGLERTVGDRQQRIVAIGDADCISNEALTTQYWFSAANNSVIQGSFRWMSYGKFPIDTAHGDPIDNDISLGRGARPWTSIVMLGLLPGLLLFAGLVLIIKRQRG